MAAFTFWIITILLLIVSLAFVLYPLLKSRRNQVTVSREEINKAIYHGKVEDLQADLDKGLLDQDEYEHALADLQQTLLQDAQGAQGAEEKQDIKTGNNVFITVAMTIFLPVVVIVLYQQVSTGEFVNDVVEQQALASMPQSLENSIAMLEEKLKDKPDNVEGWKMLGQSYFVMQRYSSAKDAYIKALNLVNQSDPELLVLTAEASAFSNNELFADYEKSLLRKALSINPRNERALWYSGYAAYASADYPGAVQYWQSLLQLVPAERPEVKESLVRFLDDAREKAGLTPQNSAITVAENNEQEQARAIQVSVQLNEKVNQLANSGDTLFVYARPAQGPKMPLSLARMTVSNLPVKITLSKDMAMIPNMTIESFDKVEVLARISKSGQATTQKGDLISQGVIVDFSQANTATVSLDIDSVVE